MKIRNVFCSLVVAFAVVSVSQAATATDLDVVHTAYEAYEGAAKALERSIDVVHSKLNTAGLTPEEMQKLQLQLDALKAQHDVALGRLMVEAAKKQQI